MKKITIDLETCSADELHSRPDFVRLAGYQIDDGPVITTTDIDSLTPLIESADIITGHNITGFDLIALSRWHGLDLASLRGRIHDTDLSVRTFDPPPSGKDGVAIRPRGFYGLDQSARRFGIPGKTDDLKGLARRHGGYDLIPTDDPDYVSYLAGDVAASTALHAAIPCKKYDVREGDIHLMTAMMSATGFRVDVPELHRALMEQAVRKAENLRELAAITGLPLTRTRLYKTRDDVTEPLASPLASAAGKDAIERWMTGQGIKPGSLPRTGKTGALCLSGEPLTEFAAAIKAHARDRDVSQILHVLTLIRDVVSERTVYATARDCLIGDRVHPGIRPYQATGRWSVTKPGLTVYGKRGGRHVERRIFLPEPGHVVVCFDLAQVDARAVAAHSGDAGYIGIFTSGADLHSSVAMQVFGSSSKTLRDTAKTISHGWSYGRSARAISEGTGVDINVAEHFNREMRRKYPKLVEWQQRVRDVASAGQLLDNGFGRMMRADPRFAYTQAPALVGQGCTRDILSEGMLRLPVELWPYLRVIVHDELVFSLPEGDAEEISRVIVDAMTFDLADVTNGRLASVPIEAGASPAGKSWAQCYD